MKNPLRLFAFVLCAIFNMRIAHAQTPMDLQQQADKAFTEKSYARALELYRNAKAAGPVREAEKVDYRIVVSLFKTEKWDEAIDSANFAVKSAVWKARFQYLLGQITIKAPKSGWKLGDKTWRQDEYPKVEGDQKALPFNFYAQDQKNALEALETAVVSAQKERDIAMRSRFATPIFPLNPEEQSDLYFDLAAYLPQIEINEFIALMDKHTGEKFDEAIDG
ncbi:hypothetical protein EON80_05120, partial [bacterium]